MDDTPDDTARSAPRAGQAEPTPDRPGAPRRPAVSLQFGPTKSVPGSRLKPQGKRS